MKANSLASHQQDPRWALIGRIAASTPLRGSPRLCELLLYVADCALRNSPEEVTEQQIGIQIFGRPAGFNSSEDSIVRTQVRLLRIKMAAYFAGEGAGEPMMVDIPKGHYLPVFHLLETSAASEPAGAGPPGEASAISSATPRPETALELSLQPLAADATEAPLAERLPTRQQRSASRLLVNLAAGFLLAVVLAGLFAGARLLGRQRHADASPVLTLWRPFLAGEPPLVIYSNALFEGDSKTGLRYAAPDAPHQQPMPEHFVDHYTGVGELVSVYEITRLFDSRQATFTLKRSLLVTWDEAKLRNLIFVGAAAENGSMRVLPPAFDFTMTSGNGFAGILNQHPAKGEPATLSRPEYPLTRDYAIIALLPGVTPGRSTLVLSGLTTLGTEAAVEFACRPESVAELLKTIGYTSGEVRPFQAVLEVTLGGGVPLQSKILLVRAH